MIKEQQIDELDDLDAYKGKWANLTFLTDGTSHLPPTSHDTKRAAKSSVDSWMVGYLRGDYTVLGCLCGCYRNYPVEDYSHTIQIPIGA